MVDKNNPEWMRAELKRLEIAESFAAIVRRYSPNRPKKEVVASRQHKNKYLYFMACGDAVKIGVSSCPDSRLETLQTGAPGELSLVASIPNAGHLEAECHRRLSHLHLSGEWFRHTEEVDALIKELSR